MLARMRSAAQPPAGPGAARARPRRRRRGGLPYCRSWLVLAASPSRTGSGTADRSTAHPDPRGQVRSPQPRRYRPCPTRAFRTCARWCPRGGHRRIFATYEALAAGERPRSEAARSARTRHQELVQLPQKPDERLDPGGQRRREYNRRLGIREPQIERRRDSISPDKKSGVRCPGVMTVLIGRSIMATWIASCSTRPTCWSSDGPTWRRESECHA